MRGIALAARLTAHARRGERLGARVSAARAPKLLRASTRIARPGVLARRGALGAAGVALRWDGAAEGRDARTASPGPRAAAGASPVAGVEPGVSASGTMPAAPAPAFRREMQAKYGLPDAIF